MQLLIPICGYSLARTLFSQRMAYYDLLIEIHLLLRLLCVWKGRKVLKPAVILQELRSGSRIGYLATVCFSSETVVNTIIQSYAMHINAVATAQLTQITLYGMWGGATLFTWATTTKSVEPVRDQALDIVPYLLFIACMSPCSPLYNYT